MAQPFWSAANAAPLSFEFQNNQIVKWATKKYSLPTAYADTPSGTQND